MSTRWTNNSSKTVLARDERAIDWVICIRTQDTSTNPANVTSPLWAKCKRQGGTFTLTTEVVTSLSRTSGGEQ